MTVIVDTTVWIDYFRGLDTPQTVWLDEAMSRQRLGITDLILCEILQGIRDQKTYTRVRDAMMKYQVFSTGGAELAIATANNYRLLRSKGVTIRTTIDCLIATFCIENKHALLHSDRDYDPFEKHLGLKVIQL